MAVSMIENLMKESLVNKKPRIVAIIPARGGSKGIPRKNIRMLNGKPLISYTIKTCQSFRYVDEVVVSTDDDEIAEISKLYGAKVVKRPDELGKDNVTLDPVIFDAVNRLETEEGAKYDYVITVQPTSPLLSRETLDAAVEECILKDYDTIIASKEERHLYWKKTENGFEPMYSERKNRQELEPIYRETGAFVITKREFVREDSRFGKNIYLFVVPEGESVDIDSREDWWIAENKMRKLKIFLRVDGGKNMGMGHVYRAITLAHALSLHNDVIFLIKEDSDAVLKKIRENNYTIITFENEDELFRILKESGGDIVINDILDTEDEYVDILKRIGYFVVNFEDLGSGADKADIVFNALYENTNPPPNHYFGYKYVCLRDEFRLFPPKQNIEKEIKKILIIFGGSDPNNLTVRSLNAVLKLNRKDMDVEIIVGPAYSYLEELNKAVSYARNSGFHVDVKKDVKIVAKEMQESDIVITSNGRTIYEVTAMGVPCISISQNERESRHLFVHNSKCVYYLGMAENVTENKISKSLGDLISSYEKRVEMHRKALDFDIRSGMDRVIKLIYDKY